MSFAQSKGWLSQLQSTSPAAGAEIHVWVVRLDLPSEALRSLLQTLSEDETARADRFLVANAKTRFIAGRGMLRLLLSQYTGGEPGELRFEYSPQGKPSLAGAASAPGLSFNASHSSDLGLIALTTGRQVGIDVERVRPRPELLDLVSTCFAPAEQAALDQSPEATRCRTFYRLWTRKEAVLKAHGQGIAAGLKAPDVSAGLLAPAGDDWSSVELGGSRWHVRELAPAASYQGAIAVQAQG